MAKKAAQPTKKAALYIRVSTDAQREEGYSIEAQTDKLKAYCVTKDIKDYEFYVDGGFTGSNLDRPEMQRMILDAQESRLSYVIVYKLDRLSRSQKDTLHLIEDIILANSIEFVSVNEALDTTTPYGRAMIGILSAFAQLERENIRERTRMGMQKRVESGLWPGGGGTPYGYDYDSDQGVLVPNGDAEKVRQMYQLYLDGYSLQRIADAFGLKYEKLVQQILTRKSNTGCIVYNGVEYKGRHEPLIDIETFERTMDNMTERAAHKYISKAEYLLTGLIVCGKCGAKMRYMKWGKAGVKLVCYSQQKSKEYLIRDRECNNEKPWADEVEEIVINQILKFSAETRIEDEHAEQISTIDKLQGQHDEIGKKLKRLYIRCAEASDDEILEDIINEYKAQMEDIRKKINAEQSKRAISKKIVAKKLAVKQMVEIWGFMTKKEQQNMIREIVDKIVVTDNHIHIDYKF